VKFFLLLLLETQLGPIHPIFLASKFCFFLPLGNTILSIHHWKTGLAFFVAIESERKEKLR
jgi:hypothetical protein